MRRFIDRPAVVLGILWATCATSVAAADPATTKPPAAENIARGAKYTLWPAPNYSYCTDPDDKVQLTDGQTTTRHFWTQKSTVGWTHAPFMRIVLDLGRDQPIGGVSFNTAAGAASVTWPAAIEILTSVDGKLFHPAGDLVELDHRRHGPWPEKYAIRRLETNELATHGRYVMLLVIAQAGGPYTFCDEIEVFRGRDEFLQQPLAGGIALEDAKLLYQQRRLGAAVRQRFEADAAALANLAQTIPDVDAAQRQRWAADLATLREALQREAQAQGDDPQFRAVLPFGPAHARLFALQAAIYKACGWSELAAWIPAPWDPVPLIGPPPASSRDKIEIHALRGEYRAAAVNVFNSGQLPRHVRLRLVDATGATSLVARFITLHAGQWTDTSQGIPVVAALPESADGTAQVLPGLAQQLWLTFHPTDLPSGTYTGHLEIDAQQPGQPAVPKLRVPWEITVYPLQLPETPSLLLGGWCYAHPKGGRGVTDDNRPAFLRHLQERFVSVPAGTATLMLNCKFDPHDPAQVELNTELFDRWLSDWPHAQRYMVFLAVGPALGGIRYDAPQFEARVGAWISAWVKHLAGRGVAANRLFLLVYDEPHEQSDVRPLVAWARAIRKAQPDVMIWEDPTYRDPTKAPAEVFDVAHILCPNRPMWLERGKPFADFYRDQQRRGRELQLYSCSGPARLLDPYSYYRLQAWHCWQIGGTGTYFWSFSDNGGASSWNEYLAKAGPFTPLFLDDQTVVAGKQMEAIRESVEDYECLVLLRKAIQRATQAGRRDAALTDAQALLARAADEVLEAPGVKQIYWRDAKDRTIADTVRVRILKALVALQP